MEHFWNLFSNKVETGTRDIRHICLNTFIMSESHCANSFNVQLKRNGLENETHLETRLEETP